MARIDIDERYDQQGNVISRSERTVTDQEIARETAAERLRALNDAALGLPPWGPIIHDILRHLGLK